MAPGVLAELSDVPAVGAVESIEGKTFFSIDGVRAGIEPAVAATAARLLRGLRSVERCFCLVARASPPPWDDAVLSPEPARLDASIVRFCTEQSWSAVCATWRDVEGRTPGEPCTYRTAVKLRGRWARGAHTAELAAVIDAALEPTLKPLGFVRAAAYDPDGAWRSHGAARAAARLAGHDAWRPVLRRLAIRDGGVPARE
jgi:hypothetical protein